MLMVECAYVVVVFALILNYNEQSRKSLIRTRCHLQNQVIMDSMSLYYRNHNRFPSPRDSKNNGQISIGFIPYEEISLSEYDTLSHYNRKQIMYALVSIDEEQPVGESSIAVFINNRKLQNCHLLIFHGEKFQLDESGARIKDCECYLEVKDQSVARLTS